MGLLFKRNEHNEVSFQGVVPQLHAFPGWKDTCLWLTESRWHVL